VNFFKSKIIFLKLLSIFLFFSYDVYALNTPESCVSLLSPELHKEQIKFEKDIRIKTPQDFVAFWKNIDLLVEKGEMSYRDLLKVDYVRPLLNFRNQFTTSQIDQLFKIFESLQSKEFEHWRIVLLPVKIIFKPELVKDYYENFDVFNEFAKDLVDGFGTHFNYSTVSAFSTLLDDELLKFRNYFLQTLIKFRKKPPLNKNTRRNAEILYRASFEKEFQNLLQDLVKASGYDNKLKKEFLVAKVNSYWEKLGFNVSYDFDKVLDVARFIQSGPLSQFMEDKPVYLYGSFANGAAIFPSSDIDLHLDPDLEVYYKELFGEDGSFSEPENSFRASVDEIKFFQRAFFEFESLVAKALGVRKKFYFLRGYTPGNFLQVSTGWALFGPRDWFSHKYMSQQSPIMLKIDNSKIILQVYDAYQRRQVFEFEVE